MFCLRVGQRCDAVCANVVNYNSGQSFSWVTEMRYLGTYFASSRSLKCTLDMAKRSFYRTANAILRKIGGRAPEDVILELITGSAVALYYVKAHRQSQWRSPNLTPCKIYTP